MNHRAVWGGFLHNEMLRQMAAAAQHPDTELSWEHRVGHGRHARAIDLLIRCRQELWCVEAELSTQRVCADVEKAVAIGATALFLVTPTAGIAWRARRALVRYGEQTPEDLRLFVRSLGQSRAALTEFLFLKTKR